MSPAIPSPPGSGDIWGNALNNFLEVSLVGANGTLSTAAIAQVEAAAGATAAIDVTRQGVPTDGVSDCTAALKTCIANAVSGAIANGSNYAELYFPAGKYVLSGALTQGGTLYKGNAQVPLPVISPTGEKFTLVMRCGLGGGDSLPLWTQTVGQTASGACLYSTITGAYSGTYGTPSVLGGPTSEQGYGNSNDSTFLFSNMHLILDGISVCSSTTNPTMTAFDFQGLAQLTVRSAGAFCDARTLGTGGVGTIFPTHNWAIGLRPPSQGNNALCNIYSWSCEGYYTGLIITEHCVVTRTATVYCNRGVAISAQGYAHGNIIIYACIESCGTYLQWDTYTHCIVLDMDVEHNHGSVFDGGFDIIDGGNGRGYVGFEVSGGGEGEGTEPVVSGCQALKINNIGRKAATVNPTDVPAIAVPATTVAFQNPLWKDALIAITGGTVTAVAVNTGGIGARTLFTATPCLVPLPSGAFITLTYSAAPTWVWTLI
jgi:hypothetical protein